MKDYENDPSEHAEELPDSVEADGQKVREEFAKQEMEGWTGTDAALGLLAEILRNDN